MEKKLRFKDEGRCIGFGAGIVSSSTGGLDLEEEEGEEERTSCEER